MKAPDKIYLQACGDCPGFDSCQSCKFDDLEEVTWAEEKVWEKDIPYIRKEALLEWAKEHKVELLDSAKTMDTDSVGKCINAGALTMLDNVIDKINSL